MADLFFDEKPSKIYWDRQHFDSLEAQVQQLRHSPLVYVGNLGFYTSETQIRAYFALCGPVKQIIMGLNRLNRRPCGFCFVEYFQASQALHAVRLLNATELDGQTIKVELDPGFLPGRQYGRGSAGGQVQDDAQGFGAGGRQQAVVAPWLGPGWAPQRGGGRHPHPQRSGHGPGHGQGPGPRPAPREAGRGMVRKREEAEPSAEEKEERERRKQRFRGEDGAGPDVKSA